MNKRTLTLLALVLVPACFAADGVVLISQSSVMARREGSRMGSLCLAATSLRGNLTVPAKGGIDLQDGIDIHSPNVTLDLNGFAIIGSGTTGSGVGVASQAQNIRLKNGAIK